MALSVGFVEEHQRLYLGVRFALPTRSFPRPAKTACQSKCDHQPQEVKHEEFEFAWPLHCVSQAPTLRFLMKPIEDLGRLYPKSSHSTNSYRVLIQITFDSLPCDTQSGGFAALPSGSERM